jgi:hypothetical protein
MDAEGRKQADKERGKEELPESRAKNAPSRIDCLVHVFFFVASEPKRAQLPGLQVRRLGLRYIVECLLLLA